MTVSAKNGSYNEKIHRIKAAKSQQPAAKKEFSMHDPEPVTFWGSYSDILQALDSANAISRFVPDWRDEK